MATARFPGYYENLDRIRTFVAEAAEYAELDDKAAYAVQSAVDEACTNIIEHAYGGEGPGEIICTCIDTGDGLKIILQDFGKPFDPDTVPGPKVNVPLEDIKIGGLGLFFIRKLMDEVKFEFTPNQGNILTLFKRKDARS
jgi:serine/threonine-protein kinase RsbW